MTSQSARWGVTILRASVASVFGWFVVGAGRGGAEYSALISASLVALGLADPLAYRLGRTGGVAE